MERDFYANTNMNSVQTVGNANDFLITLFIIVCICIGFIATVSMLFKKEKTTIYVTNIIFDIVIFIRNLIRILDGSTLNSNLIYIFIITQWAITILLNKFKFKNEKIKMIFYTLYVIIFTVFVCTVIFNMYIPVSFN